MQSSSPVRSSRLDTLAALEKDGPLEEEEIPNIKSTDKASLTRNTNLTPPVSRSVTTINESQLIHF